MRRLRVSVLGLMALVLAVAVGIAALRFASPVWAGIVLLPTLGVMALSVLGTILRRGPGRAFWLGFALLGWGYMALAAGSWWDRSVNRPELVTTMLLDRIFPIARIDQDPVAQSPIFAPLLAARDDRSQAILAQLDKPISLPFPRATPLEDVLRYIKQATAGPTLPSGILIYIDSIGLDEVGKTESSPVKINVEGVPLRTSLDLLLAQLNLSYRIRDGILMISAKGYEEDAAESFRRVGHCLFALLAAGIGGFAGRAIHATHDES